MEPINLYTDGSSRGNPGPGGYGVVLSCGPYRKELSGGFRNTTNNRMELLAVIVGLEAISIQTLLMWLRQLMRVGSQTGRKRGCTNRRMQICGSVSL